MSCQCVCLCNSVCTFPPADNLNCLKTSGALPLCVYIYKEEYKLLTYNANKEKVFGTSKHSKRYANIEGNGEQRQKLSIYNIHTTTNSKKGKYKNEKVKSFPCLPAHTQTQHNTYTHSTPHAQSLAWDTDRDRG